MTPNARKQINRRFGRWVWQRRHAQELTQAELGAKVGMARSTISAIETGRMAVTLPDVVAFMRFFPSDGLWSAWP
jgi:transcriptional regulator with XRE-family HTH domain